MYHPDPDTTQTPAQNKNTAQPLLQLHNIACAYHKENIFSDLSLHINKGAIACLLGPSGCGKTTVLRAIAGFEELTAGEILIQGKRVSAPGYILSPDKRGLGMVFQDYALFPHMTLNNNIGFGLRHLSPPKRQLIIDDMLATVGMQDFGKRYPHELSGGQQQRIALARALAAEPRLLLLDEPFSNLDIDLRERLGQDIRKILKERGISTLLVTHDQHEAFALGDLIGIMNNGRILQWDTPFNLYHEPSNLFVADFIGQGVLLKGTMRSNDSVETEIGIITGDRAYPWPVGTVVDVLIRPDDIIYDPEGSLRGTIIHEAFKGAEILYTLSFPSGCKVLTLFPSHQRHSLGDTVGIRLAADHLVAFPSG